MDTEGKGHRSSGPHSKMSTPRQISDDLIPLLDLKTPPFTDFH